MYYTIVCGSFQFTLVADQRLVAHEVPKLRNDVPQFSCKINEKIVEWVTDVRLREAEPKDETNPRFGPRLYRRGLLGQPKQIIKTVHGHGHQANFITTTFRNNGFGNALERRVRERWTISSI